MKKLYTICAMLVLFKTCLVYGQSGERWFFNIDDRNLAIQGYDVVGYFTKSEAQPGSEEFKTTHKGITYFFASTKNLKTFQKDPEAYLPSYGGWCAYSASLNVKTDGFPASRIPIDPTSFKIVDSRLFLFAKMPNFDGLEVWSQGDEKELIKKADTFWNSRIKLSQLANGLPKGLNPNARMENLQWQKLMGLWKGSVQWMVDTVSLTYSQKITAKWEFYYGFKGYCIQDDWFPDNYLSGNGIWAGPAIRGYDPTADEWHMTYIPINSARQNTWLMTANFNEKGELEGKMESVDPNGDAFMQRIYFYDITEDQFLWHADRSYNQGKTWIKNVGKSVQTRIKSN